MWHSGTPVSSLSPGGELEKLAPAASQLRQHGRRDGDHGRGRGAGVRQEDHPRQPAAQDASEVTRERMLRVHVLFISHVKSGIRTVGRKTKETQIAIEGILV